jgi:hypothetical protein
MSCGLLGSSLLSLRSKQDREFFAVLGLMIMGLPCVFPSFLSSLGFFWLLQLTFWNRLQLQQQQQQQLLWVSFGCLSLYFDFGLEDAAAVKFAPASSASSSASPGFLDCLGRFERARLFFVC